MTRSASEGLGVDRRTNGVALVNSLSERHHRELAQVWSDLAVDPPSGSSW